MGIEVEIYRCDIPNWAMSALVNGDYSGLSEEDCETVNKWVESWEGPIDISPTDEGDGFNPYPEFGLACDTTTCIVTVYGKEGAR